MIMILVYSSNFYQYRYVIYDRNKNSYEKDVSIGRPILLMRHGNGNLCASFNATLLDDAFVYIQSFYLNRFYDNLWPLRAFVS